MTDPLLQQALEALEAMRFAWDDSVEHPVIAALRERIAQPEQEPVAHVVCLGVGVSMTASADGLAKLRTMHGAPLYTAPPAQPADHVLVPILEKYFVLLDKHFPSAAPFEWQQWEDEARAALAARPGAKT